LIRAIIALIVGMALMALAQYSVAQAPHGFSADAFGYLCYYTVLLLGHLTVGLHLGGLRGAQVAANVITMAEILAMVAFVVWFATRGLVRKLPSREEVMHTVPAQWGLGKIALAVLLPLIVLGGFYVFVLRHFVPSTGFWVPSMPVAAVGTMIVLVVLLVALNWRPRSET
jgi:hypothetical protein